MTNNNPIALITGATSGFGVVVAEHLVKSGYSLFMCGRSKEEVDTAAGRLKNLYPACKLETVVCDLSSFQSVAQACQAVKKVCDHIDLLVLNAGLWNFEFKESEDHIEETLQVNLLSPVLIFHLLLDLLPANGATKVIFTTSGLHQGNIEFADIEFRQRFSGFKSYRQSKLALILVTRFFAGLAKYSGISFYCVHPGLVNTKLSRNAGWFAKLFFRLMGKSPQKGARTHNFLIDQPAANLSSGAYYTNCHVSKTTAASYDMQMAEKLLVVIENYFVRFLKHDPKA